MTRAAGNHGRRTVTRAGITALLLAGLAIGASLAAGAGHRDTYPVRAASAAPAPTGPGAPIAFRLFPDDNPWNTTISDLPIDPRSTAYIASIGAAAGLHADFGTTWNGAPNGIPYVVVPGNQPKVPISFYYADESDPGPYPIPPDVPIEGGPNGDGDRHVLVLDVDDRTLYEVYDAHKTGSGWEAGSGAVFDLTSNGLRPDGWTSADAAGLPILPGLVRYDEVMSGEIDHALRFTVPRTQRAFVHPATHFASDSTDPDLPPMGLRLRLKKSFDVSGFPPAVQVILRALKEYGMFVADNGGAWYLSGAPDPRWDDDALHTLSQVRGSDFEVADGRALPPPTTTTTAPPTPPSVFGDVLPGDPYYTAVDGLARALIIAGYPIPGGREFRPENPVKRAQFAKMIVGVLGLPLDESMRAPFSDLGIDDPADLYPHQYVAAAAAWSITVGTAPDRFSPWRDVTRAQAVTMAVRGAGSRLPGAIPDPPDGFGGTLGTFDTTHSPFMRAAEATGLLDGPAGFGPDWDPWAPASRGEVAQILWNLWSMRDR